MNIPSVKSDGIVPPAKAEPPPPKALLSRSAEDVFKPEEKQKLMQALHAEPDARPEAVERARALAADPAYPSDDVLRKVAEELLQQTLR